MTISAGMVLGIVALVAVAGLSVWIGVVSRRSSPAIASTERRLPSESLDVLEQLVQLGGLKSDKPALEPVFQLLIDAYKAQVTEIRQQNDHKYLRYTRFAVALGVSIPILTVALYMVVTPEAGSEEKKWAFGTIGCLLGFWLKP